MRQNRPTDELITCSVLHMTSARLPKKSTSFQKKKIRLFKNELIQVLLLQQYELSLFVF